MKTAKVVQQDQNRADYMEYLYELYDRGYPGVENCFTYTGLFQKHVELAGAEFVKAQVERFHEVEGLMRSGDVELSSEA